MQITINLDAQVRRAAGRESTTIDVADHSTVAGAVQKLAVASEEPLRKLLVDDSGAVRPTLMVFLNDEHVPLSSECQLASGAVLTITSPISGG